MLAHEAFENEINAYPIDLIRAGLRYSQAIAYPDLDVEHYAGKLNRIADRAARWVDAGAAPGVRGQQLAYFLCEVEGIRGNQAEYTDPRNSHLHEVLDRKLGIPISLSVIYLAVAESLHIEARGIGLPGHFVVGVDSRDGLLYFDLFHGGRVIGETECQELVFSSTGYDGPLTPAWLRPLTNEQILARMLNNLRAVYLDQQAWQYGRRVLELLRLLQPDQAVILRDLGMVAHQEGKLTQAVRFYEQYLIREPDALDARDVQHFLMAAAKQLSQKN